MNRIRLDIDQRTFEQLLEQRQLTAEQFNCVDGRDKRYLQRLFLRLLEKHLINQACSTG